eukprot:4934071-Prymnesium_polylepis.1
MPCSSVSYVAADASGSRSRSSSAALTTIRSATQRRDRCLDTPPWPMADGRWPMADVVAKGGIWPMADVVAKGGVGSLRAPC